MSDTLVVGSSSLLEDPSSLALEATIDELTAWDQSIERSRRSIEPPDLNIQAGPGERNIELTRGYMAIIEEADYDLVKDYTWRANVQLKTRKVYARTDVNIGTGKQKKRKVLYMHRLIMKDELVEFGIEDALVDHENGNGLDNRRSRLAPVDVAMNIYNTPARGNGSQYRGVTWHIGGGKFYASLAVKKKRYNAPLRKNELQAAQDYDCLFLEHVPANFPTMKARLIESLLNFPEDHREALEKLRQAEQARLLLRKRRIIDAAALEEEVPF